MPPCGWQAGCGLRTFQLRGLVLPGLQEHLDVLDRPLHPLKPQVMVGRSLAVVVEFVQPTTRMRGGISVAVMTSRYHLSSFVGVAIVGEVASVVVLGKFGHQGFHGFDQVGYGGIEFVVVRQRVVCFMAVAGGPGVGTASGVFVNMPLLVDDTVPLGWDMFVDCGVLMGAAVLVSSTVPVG